MRSSGGDAYYAERGNALFLVLVAIGLFAALAYVVTQAGKEHQRAESQALTSLPRVVKYPEIVQTAVARITSSGVRAADLDFRLDATGPGAVFSPKSGGIIYRAPSAAIGTDLDWEFKGIPQDGTGWFIEGAGSNGTDGKDIFAYLNGIPKDVCVEINKLLGVEPEPLAEDPVVILTGRGATAKDRAGKNAFTFKANAAESLKPPPAACVQNGEKYVYYHLILAR